jgi:predicted DCC family thiol-disulfide oxidoreductase YuxK
VLLFDGSCPFCTGSARAVLRVFGEKRVTLSDFQRPGALEPYPFLRYDALMKKMHVVRADGRTFAGAEAFARIVTRLPGPAGWPGWLYYVPGVRQIADAVYALVAKHRYRLFARAAECKDETCKVHGPI